MNSTTSFFPPKDLLWAWSHDHVANWLTQQDLGHLASFFGDGEDLMGLKTLSSYLDRGISQSDAQQVFQKIKALTIPANVEIRCAKTVFLSHLATHRARLEPGLLEQFILSVGFGDELMIVKLSILICKALQRVQGSLYFLNNLIHPYCRLEWSAFKRDTQTPSAFALFRGDLGFVQSITPPWFIYSTRTLEQLVTTREKLDVESLTRSSASSLVVLFEFILANRTWTPREERFIHRSIKKLVATHQSLPPSFHLNQIIRTNEHPIAAGGYADIYRGTHKGTSVCLKVLRLYINPEDHASEEAEKRKVIRTFLNEAIIWRLLKHPYVLPFLGISTETFPGRLSFVSPFMRDGDIMKFLRVSPQDMKTKLTFLHQISKALQYLHTLNICHGDVKGANILISQGPDSTYTALLADLGIATFLSSQSTTITQNMTTEQGNNNMRGSVRWMAPEVIFPDRFSSRSQLKRAEGRDVYAFGCTILEVLSGECPFARERMDALVILLVLQGQRPDKPDSHIVEVDVWELIEKCWRQNVRERMAFSKIVETLDHVINVRGTGETDGLSFSSGQKRKRQSEDDLHPVVDGSTMVTLKRPRTQLHDLVDP
ncbi:kinase-like domain-containing protein [Flagelloscypha sp. PMI_526]|nr:kinase-like domain-containing protein [Flagelloscypha sp. PMI_526]